MLDRYSLKKEAPIRKDRLSEQPFLFLIIMGTKMNADDLRLYKRIDEILYFDWNPIGVSGLPRDEYQSYLPSIFRLKKSGADIESIAQSLTEHEAHILGVTGNIDQCRLIAKKIKSL